MSQPKPSTYYLGDGAYVQDDGIQVRLFVNRSEGEHEVFLEPQALQKLVDFVRKLGWVVK
jgi:hypothetical protein